MALKLSVSLVTSQIKSTSLCMQADACKNRKILYIFVCLYFIHGKKMYRGKRYRIGGGAAAKRLDSTKSTLSTVSENSSTLGSLSTVSNPKITSTPNEPVAGPSSVLKECNNFSQSQNQPVIISNDDDFVVPTSQVMQPSRYISQRSALLRSQISYTQQTPMSYFESVLNRCGVMMSDRNCDISLKLNCDHLKFVIRLRRELTAHPKYPENVQTFLSGLLDVMKNSNQMTKILSSCFVSDFFS